MTKVFIGGSRRVTRLNADVQRRINKIIEQGFPILVGDANGADKAVQTYLRSRRYHKVDVFCTAGDCRNNVGDWPIRTVPAPAGSRGFDYYAVKDDRMAEEASVGLMSRRRIFVTKLCDLRSSLKDRRGNKPRCSGRSTDRDFLAERCALFRRAR